VINLDNGKSVEVEINDRGPFGGDRAIDLSKAQRRSSTCSRRAPRQSASRQAKQNSSLRNATRIPTNYLARSGWESPILGCRHA
jgi:hypothetical protein